MVSPKRRATKEGDEHVARVAYRTIAISHDAPEISGDLHDKHFFRKHGAKAYYGQEKK